MGQLADGGLRGDVFAVAVLLLLGLAGLGGSRAGGSAGGRSLAGAEPPSSFEGLYPAAERGHFARVDLDVEHRWMSARTIFSISSREIWPGSRMRRAAR